MSERNAILARIREALRLTAARPGAHDAAPVASPGAAKTDREPASVHPAEGFTRWLPRVGAGFDELAAAFAAASKELRTDFHVLELEAGADILLAALRDAQGWQRVASHRGPLTTRVAEALGLPVLWTDGGFDPLELERCDVGITACDLLVAQTGSVLVTSASAGGRALSVLPPHHVVLARRDQLVPDLPEAFRRLQERYGTNYPSMISFVTGPSRTGDIERILVLGAHGPKHLTVLVW
jgi:L-lactate dehydrogenase complex protein LldG